MIYVLFILFLISKHDRDCSRYNYSKSLTYHFMKFFRLWTPKRAHWFISNTYAVDNWLVHNVFSFMANGWKFWEAVNVASFCSMTVLYIDTLYNIPIWVLILLGVTLYGVIGGIHSALDGSLFKKRQRSQNVNKNKNK